MASSWIIEVAFLTRITTRACGRTIGDSPRRDGSRYATFIPCRSNVGCRQPCIREGRDIKIESTVIFTKMISPKRPRQHCDDMGIRIGSRLENGTVTDFKFSSWLVLIQFSRWLYITRYHRPSFSHIKTISPPRYPQL